ncbi:hypothetical protein M407DRAFT_134147 [Tulasnella calospora MUT 4182]|uniref:Uncharacterized protein n=1 Tax=Tulasnella calospora MUT 4182 TaxID=1051891 RepID=A0A0C3Q8N7_9AGAM|nr:hypothetical protein M407DRAFT_134147 [Tulasnella calospora MUT 4182]
MTQQVGIVRLSSWERKPQRNQCNCKRIVTGERHDFLHTSPPVWSTSGLFRSPLQSNLTQSSFDGALFSLSRTSTSDLEDYAE